MVSPIRKILFGLSFPSLKADQVRNKVVDQVSFTLPLLFHLQRDGDVRQSLVI
jgi:hypothetical protein